MHQSLNRAARALAIICLTCLVVACSTFPTQEFNKSANADLHAIALAPVGMPQKPSVIILNAVGNNFGLIGGIVEATRAANAANELTGELQIGNLDYRTYLPVHIANALRSEGFEVITADGARPESEGSKFLSRPPLPNGTDATLDVYVTYIGYLAAGATTVYRPAVHIEARLVDKKTQKVLFADQIFYNNYSPGAAKQAISIEPEPRATFQDRAAMLAAPQEVTRGLAAGLDAVALELARQLK
jgi:hypothetical protein